MKLVTSKQIREIDRVAIKDYGIPSISLMTKASEHIAKAALEHIPAGGSAVAFCGTGNNGGDGIGAAAFLLQKGIPVRVFIIGDINNLTPDTAEMQKRFKAFGGSIEPFAMSFDLDNQINNCNVIIDAIFGIGLNSVLQGDALSAVSVINSSRATVISADIPSGVHADTGAILGDAVKADLTVTFSLAKPGHFVEPGCIYCGELRVCDIGVPQEALNRVVSHIYSASPKDLHLPRRKQDSHKGDYGRALIIAGSIGYTGAPALSARAASKMGAGLVSLGVPSSIYDIMAVKLDEEMPFPLPDDENGHISSNSASEILQRARKSDVCLIGPGLGVSDGISELVESIIRIANTPLVLDADGLNAIAKNPDILNQTTCPLVLTPHPGEFERLGGKLSNEDLFDNGSGVNLNTEEDDDGFEIDESVFDDDIFDDNTYDEIMHAQMSDWTSPIEIGQKPAGQQRTKLTPVDRLRAARDFASKYGCILVLKGHRTIVALPNGIAYVNTTGGPAMAKGGTGDVLAGMITALIAQKLPIVHAVATAVYLHGLAGDICADKFGEYCVTATDIIDMLPQAIKEIETI